jgi:signal peptide peptidase SppA
MFLRIITDRLPAKLRPKSRPLVPVIRLYGVISPQGTPLRPALNLAQQAEAIERAFAHKGAKAVALAINSPGGSPVQSALIHDRIRLLAAEKNIPVYTFCEDVAASGGYWLACAGDEIYANESSIIGSIGVISAGFGFHEAIGKLGIERRLHTSGEKKNLLDPFLPEKGTEVKRLTAVQKLIHDSFKAHVKERRGERLNGSARKLYSGEFWTGGQARELGLIDAIGDLKGVLQEKFGPKVRLKVMDQKRGWLSRRLGMNLRIEAPDAEGMVRGALAAAEERALWSRFGL